MYDVKKAVFYLEFCWCWLCDQFVYQYLAEKEILCCIDSWLGDVYYVIDVNCFYIVVNQLEYVKYELMVLCGYYGIDYYLDDFYDFQGGLELFIEVVSDEMFCFMDWGEFVVFGKEFWLEWQYIM